MYSIRFASFLYYIRVQAIVQVQIRAVKEESNNGESNQLRVSLNFRPDYQARGEKDFKMLTQRKGIVLTIYLTTIPQATDTAIDTRMVDGSRW